MNDRGSALLATVIAVVALALMAGVFFTFSAARAKMETSEERGLKAYYLAEAGIQYGLATVLQLEGIPDEDEQEDLGNKENPFGEVYGGTFSVEWTDEGTTLKIKSTGEYQGVERKLEARFNTAP